jgi:hypothetical protein
MGVLERITGNDPVSERWQRAALPLSYIRMVGDPGVDPGWRCFTDTAPPGGSP